MSVINKLFKSKYPQHPFCTAVIVAAGSSQRMGADKILMELGEMPVIARTLLAFQHCVCIDEIVVVTRRESIERVADICHEYGILKTSRVVCGGDNRVGSALIGVSNADPKADLIAIHDGARPFVSSQLIESTVRDAVHSRASAPAIRAHDTVRILNAKNAVVSVPDRDRVALIQTPQVFDADLIKGALTKAFEKQLPITDDCSAVEAMGFKVSIVDGEEDNIKLTTAHDLYIAQGIISKRGETV